MNHLYTNGYWYYSEESIVNCVQSLGYDNDIRTEVSDWNQLDDDKYFNIMFMSKNNGHLDRGDIIIPDTHYREKLDEENMYDGFSWSVYAKAKDWAEVNTGFLCHEI